MNFNRFECVFYPLMTIPLFICQLIKRICWEVYLLFTRLPPTQAWMDPREQTLMIEHIEQTKAKKNGAKVSMVEYGAGSSTFYFSSYVDYYVSIEHSPDYCRELERMALNQSHRSVKIFYITRNSSGFHIERVFEQYHSDSKSQIEIYCVPRNAYSIKAYRLWATGERSTYEMYRDYVDFLGEYFREKKFDFIFIDGRARPQVAYAVLKQLHDEHSKVFIHDWNQRADYHIILKEFYNLIDQQIESNQVGGGGLVVLEKISKDIGRENIREIEWKYTKQPQWWI